MGPGGSGHPAVQRRRHLAGHGRLPVPRDEDLPLGELQVSRLLPGQRSPFHCAYVSAVAALWCGL